MEGLICRVVIWLPRCWAGELVVGVVWKLVGRWYVAQLRGAAIEIVRLVGECGGRCSKALNLKTYSTCQPSCAYVGRGGNWSSKQHAVSTA